MLEIYVSTDVETDGPVAGVHSMLSLGSAAFTADKRLLGTFSANLATLPDCRPDPVTTAWWATQPEAWAANLKLLPPYVALAREAGCTPAQLALAWLLAQGEHVIPIPGTSNIAHLEENMGALKVQLSADLLRRLDALINRHTVTGPRYNPAAQADVDTEDF